MRRLPILGLLAFVAAFAQAALAAGPAIEPGGPAILQSSEALVPPPPAPAAPLPAAPPSNQPSTVPPLGSPPAPLADTPAAPPRPGVVPTPAFSMPPAGAAPGSPRLAPPSLMRNAPAPPNATVPPNATDTPNASDPPQEGAGLPPESAPSAATPEPKVHRLRDSVPPPIPASGAASPEGTAAAPPAGPPLVFRTADVVRPDMIRGLNYRLAEYAPLVDFKFQFELETPWGSVPAHGMAMLGIRLCELKSIEYGSRIARKNPMFVEGIAQVACKTPVGAYILVTDPIDSVYRTAVGLKRIALAKWSPGGLRANCGARRKLACLLCCDPETRNPVLLCLLDDMSANATAGWLGADAALNFGLPGLGFLPANAEFKQMMAFKSTREIQADLCTSLTMLGIPETVSTKFLASENYTTTQRMAFVYYLRKLVGIENLASLVEGAADSVNEAEALASIQELQLLVDLRRTHPIARAAFIGLPAVTMSDGSQMLVSADDYLVESPPVVEMIGRYRAEFPNAPTMLVTLGRVSSGAEQQFLLAGIAVAHHRFGNDDFNAQAEKAAQTALSAGPATGTSKR
jgi:hypothetical protein